MKLKTLHVGQNLEENISAAGTPALPQICTDNFDDYADREWPCHWHSEIELGIVIKGTAEFKIYGEDERDTISLETGDGIYIAGGCLHSAAGIEPCSIITEAVFSGEMFNGSSFGILFNRYLQTLSASGVKYISFRKGVTEDEPALSAIKEMCVGPSNLPEDALYAMEALCKICRVLLARTQELGNTKPFINTAIDLRIKEMLSYIHAHFAEKITVADLLGSAGISRTECFKIFKDVLGQSPIEYLTQYRMSCACSLLTGSDYTVSEIAGLCGYENPSFFGKVFKTKYGMTPNLYRKASHNPH